VEGIVSLLGENHAFLVLYLDMVYKED